MAARGKNAYQVLLANQVVQIQPKDILYLAQYPYTDTDNGGIYFEDLLAQIEANISGIPSVVVTASTQALTVNTRYYINRPSLVMLTMPTMANVGDTIEIVNMSNSWQLSQSAGINIRIANAVTTTGAAGSIASSNVGDSITLECMIENDLWMATSVIGNITVV